MRPTRRDDAVAGHHRARRRSRRSAPGLPAFRDGPAARRVARSSASTASTRRRSAPRSRPRSTTSSPLDHMDAARGARRSTGSSQFGLATGRMAMADAGLVPGRRRRPPTPSGSGSTSAPRWAASRSPRPSTSSTSSAGCAPCPPPSRSPCSAARRRPTSASRSTCAGRSSRRRTRAPRGPSRSARRCNAIRAGEIDAAIAGGVECPLSPLAFGAFDIIRALSHGHNDDPAHASRPMDAGRDGFVMGEGAGAARARGGGRRAAPRRAALRRGAWATARRRTPTTWSSRGPTAGRRHARSRIALADARVTPGEIDWVSAHASSTPIGDIAEARAIAAALGDRAATVPVSATKGADRPPARRDRGDRGGDGGARRSATAGCPGPRTSWRPEPELAALLPGLLARRPRRSLRAPAVDVVRLRRAQRGARVRRRDDA